MNKSNYFFGQSVFGQLISLLDLTKVNTVARKHLSDRYVKKFDTSDHLISMLFFNIFYESVIENDIPSYIDNGVMKDEIIRVEIKENGKYLKTIELRKIAYWDDENKRCFEFITNLMGMNAGHIALIYKKRWQIELLFKQLKQNSPLKFFSVIMKIPLKYRSGVHLL
jgi:hypothetical protein